MAEPVVIVGIGAEGPSGLSARGRLAIEAATFLAGGRRHLGLVRRDGVETFAIGDNLDALVDRLRRRGEGERCVVLASGDPLFFGIGHRLGEELGRGQIVVEPALSSIPLAFARAGLAWHDATIASIHGRPLAKTLLPLLGRPKIGLFAQDGSSPSAVARFFLERGLDDYQMWVGENLGATDERMTALPLPDLVGRRFGDLNVLILLRTARVPEIAPGPSGRPDSLFARPESGPVLLTHADVRAVALSRFQGLPDGPIWDVGAGLGGVSVELARAFPDREVLAVERDAERCGFLTINRSRFSAYNLRIVAGEAPEALSGEERPAGMFLGGSGGRLDAILDLARDRLVDGGVLVANFVGIENVARCLERLKGEGWPAEVSQIAVSHGTPLAGLTTFAPERPVWVVRGVKQDH